MCILTTCAVQTVYVSGALCGLSQASWPGEDHADYPSDLVPSVVKRLFNSQLFHDQRQTQLRMRYNKEDRESLECIDYSGCSPSSLVLVQIGSKLWHLTPLQLCRQFPCLLNHPGTFISSRSGMLTLSASIVLPIIADADMVSIGNS